VVAPPPFFFWEIVMIDVSAAVSALEDAGVAALAVGLAYVMVAVLVGLYRNIRSLL